MFNTDDLENLVQLSIDALQEGYKKKAFKYFEEVIQKSPENLNIYLEIGLKRLESNQINQAKEIFDLVLKKDNKNSEALLGIGECLRQSNQLIDALNIFYTGIKTQDEKAKFYEKASFTFISCFFEGSQDKLSNFPVHKEFNENLLIEELILQNESLKTSSYFLGVLAHSPYNLEHDVLPHLSQRLLPVLQKLVNTEKLNKNLVVTLLYLRKWLTPIIDGAKISEFHQQYFYQFAVEDLAIIYNFAFTKFLDKNREDLVKITNYIQNNWSQLRQIQLYQILLLAWLNPEAFNFLNNIDNIVKLFNLQFNQEIINKQANHEASKNLLLRYLDTETNKSLVEFKGFFDDFNFSEEYFLLIEEIRKRRSMLLENKSKYNSNLLKFLMNNRTYQGINVVLNYFPITNPLTVLRGKKLKVAICISGQLRGFTKAFSTWEKTLLKDIDYELFIHTWQQIGRSEPKPFRAYLPWKGKHFTQSYKEQSNLIGYEKMLQRYPQVFQYFRTSGKVTEEELSKIYNTNHVVVENEHEERFINFSNQDKMHYKIYACHQYMLNQNKNYDLCIRIRPDKAISLIGLNWQDIYRRCKTEPVIFAETPSTIHFGIPLIGDQFAVGDMQTMSLYSDTWNLNSTISSQKLFEWPENLTGHINLAQVCWTHGITVEKVPIKWSDLLEAEPCPLSTILEKIRIDAENRMDKTDKKLIQALKLDLQSIDS